MHRYSGHALTSSRQGIVLISDHQSRNGCAVLPSRGATSSAVDSEGREIKAPLDLMIFPELLGESTVQPVAAHILAISRSVLMQRLTELEHVELVTLPKAQAASWGSLTTAL